MATITFCGAAQEVTGSCHLLETGGTKLLLDCGIHQGGDAIERIRKDDFLFDPRTINAVVLSHAHLDHSGLLPKLVNNGFVGPIFCTKATKELLSILLTDAFNIYNKDLDRENIRRARRGRKPLDPEYSVSDVNRVLASCQTHEFGELATIDNGTTLRLHDAGHILGAAIIELQLDEEKLKTLVFSGDLGSSESSLMNNPAALDSADILLAESTYGDRDHRSLEDTIEELTQILDRTWAENGNILIPSFAVGRTQELLFQLGLLHHQGLLDNWKVFLDSPMAIEVTKIYDNWLHILNRSDVKHLSDAHRNSLEKFLPSLECCITAEQSMAINKIDSGAIIIAGSGMCTGGRIRHHIKHRIWKPSNTIIFVGFQAQGTLGRLLIDGVSKIKMFGDQYVVKAKIETLGGFSAHAGRSELITWISRFTSCPRICLVHGEVSGMQSLSKNLLDEHDIRSQLPERGEKITF